MLSISIDCCSQLSTFATFGDSKSLVRVTRPEDSKSSPPTTLLASNPANVPATRAAWSLKRASIIHANENTSLKTINETEDTITSLQSEVASLDAKGSLDDNEEIKKDHILVHELEKQVEKLPMELQLKNNFREALETTLKDLEKKMFDLNPLLHDP
nr:myosin heavy chain-related protein [Tanacetum cinerariifolium]